MVAIVVGLAQIPGGAWTTAGGSAPLTPPAAQAPTVRAPADAGAHCRAPADPANTAHANTAPAQPTAPGTADSAGNTSGAVAPPAGGPSAGGPAAVGFAFIHSGAVRSGTVLAAVVRAADGERTGRCRPGCADGTARDGQLQPPPAERRVQLRDCQRNCGAAPLLAGFRGVCADSRSGQRRVPAWSRTTSNSLSPHSPRTGPPRPTGGCAAFMTTIRTSTGSRPGDTLGVAARNRQRRASTTGIDAVSSTSSARERPWPRTHSRYASTSTPSHTAPT